MSKNLTKIWVTKYALTSGIFEAMAEVEKDNQEMAYVPKNYETSEHDMFFHGDDWHLSKSESVKKAKKMRIKKIVSIKKQIIKLEKMEF